MSACKFDGEVLDRLALQLRERSGSRGAAVVLLRPSGKLDLAMVSGRGDGPQFCASLAAVVERLKGSLPANGEEKQLCLLPPPGKEEGPAQKGTPAP